MKKVGLLLILAVIILFSGVNLEARTDEFDFIAKKADVIIFLNNNPDDTGLGYVMNLWRERFEIKETTTKNDAIKKLYDQMPSGTLVAAAYLPQEAFDADKEPVYPEFLVVVEVKSNADVLVEAIKTLIKKRKPLKTVTYEGYEITYRDKAQEPYHGEKDIAAYVQVGKYFILGMEPKDLYQAIDVSKGKIPSFSENKDILKLLKEGKDADTYLLVNNQNGLFSKNLKRWEEKEGLRVLLSSESIEAMLFSVDLATDDAVKGKLIFKPKAGEDIISIEDDACFFEEIINRSFVKQDINWASEVKRDDNDVTLSFEGTGFKRIWEEALLNKRVAFIEEERAKRRKAEESIIEVSPSNASAKFLKVIFVSVVVFLVLVAIIIFKGRK
jgi:hypothetical protein